MAKETTATELSKVISDLLAQREDYVSKVEEIDKIFSQFGINTTAKAAPVKRKVSTRGAAAASAEPVVRKGKPGRKPGSKVASKPGRRTRGKFKTSGEQDVIDFIASSNEPTTKDVNAFWSGQGRGGKADNTLSKLCKEGKIKRIEIPGQRGSRYTVGK